MLNLNDLNNGQRMAARQIEGPVMILAGAGSGKTRTITYRIAYMISQGIRPENILAITFTNKAAKEMKERALKLLEGNGTTREPVLSTFHSFGYEIMKYSGQVLGYKKFVQICDADDSLKRIKRICKELKIDTKIAADIANWISKAKDRLLMPEDITGIEPNTTEEQAYFVYQKYQQELFEDNQLDFDDLILQPVRLFAGYPDVLNYYQDRYRYITVDEYQDTSHSQFELIKLLASKYQNICVVGDDYQSIYAFRGADISNILNFQYQYPDALTVTIGQNYRSTHMIVDAASALIKNNPEQLTKHLQSMNEPGETIKLYEAEDDRAEASFVANKISELMQQGAQPQDFAVLYRKNAYSRAIEDALMRARIPYRIFGGLSFYQRAEIKDMIAYLKLLGPNTSSDRIALERIINVPKRGIGSAKIKLMAELATKYKSDMYHVALNAPELDKIAGIVQFRQEMTALQNIIKTNKLSDAIREIMHEIGYEDYLKSKSLQRDDDTVEDRCRNLSELCNKAYEYEQANPNLSKEELLELFISDVTLLTDQDMAADSNVVSLMSMHRSKGLEFPCVFMIGCEEGCFPHDPAYLGNTPDVREDRRLCYVAITRAKTKLFISYSQTRMIYGEIKNCFPSRYIEELPVNMVEWV